MGLAVTEASAQDACERYVESDRERELHIGCKSKAASASLRETPRDEFGEWIGDSGQMQKQTPRIPFSDPTSYHIHPDRRPHTPDGE